MTLTEFLLARIAGREAAINFAREHGFAFPVMSSVEMLAECAAKRRRVDLFARWDALCPPGEWPEGDMTGAPLSDAGRYLMRLEATPYVDHPDYDESWRP